jgi:hypothetical protein
VSYPAVRSRRGDNSDCSSDNHRGGGICVQWTGDLEPPRIAFTPARIRESSAGLTAVADETVDEATPECFLDDSQPRLSRTTALAFVSSGSDS